MVVQRNQIYGVLCSQTLSFSEATEVLRRKTFNRINILKVLAQKRYSSRFYHLLILTSSTIYSLIEHGAVILNAVYDNVFKHLEVF